MAHFFYNFLQAYFLLVIHLEHCWQRMLNQWPAAWRIEVFIFLFLFGMCGMICSYNIYIIVQQSLHQCFLVCFSFNGRIPFNECSLLLIIGIIEPQMVHTYFGSNLFIFK